MAKRYRNFVRLCMSAPAAKVIEAKLVDLTFTDHYQKCVHRGVVDTESCRHALDVARMVAPGLRIGIRRATLDLPDNPELVLKFVSRLRGFTASPTAEVRAHLSALNFVAEDAHAWATRGPLHRLAEAGLDLDDAEE